MNGRPARSSKRSCGAGWPRSLLVCLVFVPLFPIFQPLLTRSNGGSAPAGVSPLPGSVLSEIFFGSWALATTAAWSPDGNWLAVASGDFLYLLSTGQLTAGGPGEAPRSISPPAGHHIGSLTQGLGFSPDNLWLSAASRDGNIRVWRSHDLAQSPAAEPVLTIEAHRKGANTVAFSPDGTRLASGGNDAVARFWGLPGGDRLGLMIGGTYAVPSIAFLPDGKTLAVINGDRIRLREVGSERIIGTFASEAGLYSIAVSPDGHLLAAGGSDNRIRLWDPGTAFKTGSERYPVPRLLEGHTGQVGTFRALIWRVSFSPDGRLLASAGGDGTVRLWDVAAGALVETYRSHPGGASSVAFHPLGQYLASTGLDGRLVIYRLGSQ